MTNCGHVPDKPAATTLHPCNSVVTPTAQCGAKTQASQAAAAERISGMASVIAQTLKAACGADALIQVFDPAVRLRLFLYAPNAQAPGGAPGARVRVMLGPVLAVQQAEGPASAAPLVLCATGVEPLERCPTEDERHQRAASGTKAANPLCPTDLPFFGYITRGW